MNRTHLDPTVRHDMVLLFDVTDGNPNGNPDAGNQPRMDIESGHGLVTDVCIKRKIRNALPLAAEGDPRYGIFVEAGIALNTRLAESYAEHGLKLGAKKITAEQAATARTWLCERYADIRLFGAVLSTGETNQLGQIHGPFQMGMGRSYDPVMPTEHAITRVTQTRQADIDNGESTEMGSKWTIPYALYKMEITYSASRGVQTGVNEQDFELFYRTLEMMFDHDRSATRGMMTTRGVYVFSHSNAYGDAPAHKLFERISVTRRDENADSGPRSFGEYRVDVDTEGLPAGAHISQPV